MIVDVHTHLPSHAGDVPEAEERFDTVMRPDRPVRLTNGADDYIGAMGPVDRAIVFGIAVGPGSSGPLPGMGAAVEVNDAAAAVAAGRPEKVIGFMSVHPEDAGVLGEMERCVEDLRLRGVKLGANYQGFDPVGEPAYRVYDFAQRHGLPIVFHQGTSPFPNAPLSYAHPLVMDEIAMAFPELRVVMAHMGHPWQADCIMVIRKHPNVYADVSGQLYRPWSTYNALRLAHEWGVTHKLLFASDWPVTTPAETIEYLRGFNRFADAHHLPLVPNEELEAIIERDALGLLGLEQP